MSTLALNRRLLAWAGAPLLLLAACPSDDVPSSDETTAQSDTQTSPGSTGPAATDGSSSGGEPLTTTGPGSDDTTTQGPATTAVDSSGSDGGSSGPVLGVCGNNIIEEGEVCDLAQVSGETCESQGYQGGELGCLLTCEGYNLLGCFICGDGTIDLVEDCEGEVPDDVTCQSLGFEGGYMSCGDDCLYDVSECSFCGDGIQSGFEQCDGLDFGGQTCATMGFEGGNLACNLAECAFVYSGCVGGQYVQDFEASMSMPIELQVSASAPWTVDATMPINGTRSARSGSLPGGGVTTLTLEASFPSAGTISFFHIESTAAGWDYLQFYRDGVMQQSWTGITAAAQYTAPVAAGNHTFEWRFQRSGFANGGQNAVWVDDITLEGGIPL